MSFETHTDTKTQLQGKLLVATPYINHAPYHHSVVLVIQHTDRGACGLVLQNDLQATLAEVQEMFRKAADLEKVTANRLNGSERGEQGVSLFAGAIVWPASQLEREIQAGIWMTTPAHLTSDSITNDLWASLVERIGRSVLEDALGIHEFPEDPSLN